MKPGGDFGVGIEGLGFELEAGFELEGAGFEGDLFVGAVGEDALDIVAGEGGEAELTVLDDVDEFVEKQTVGHGGAGGDEMAESNGGGEGEVRVVEAELLEETGEGRVGDGERVALGYADLVEEFRLEVRRHGGFVRGGEGGGGLVQVVAVATDVVRDWEGEEGGEHWGLLLLLIGGVAKRQNIVGYPVGGTSAQRAVIATSST
ncbi:MAG: hypothetical protein JNM66_29475 [Bryobacterales bacterium]|nr:hypothetical protein [Bryobacterales bacterium]